MIAEETTVDVECAFCSERFMFESLRQVEVIRNTGTRLGTGNLVFICPFCISDRQVETEEGEWLMTDYVMILYTDESKLHDIIKQNMEKDLVDKMYLEHRKSLFVGWTPN